jgi:prophage DNA circulation protein
MRPLALLLPVMLVLPACSGEGGGDDSLEDRRAAYVEAAEQACSEANEQVAAVPAPTSVDAVAPYAEQVVEVLEQTVQEVTALEAPEEDRAELTEKVLDPLASDVERAREYAEQVREAAEGMDNAALLELVQNVPETSADVAFMRDYGLVECASAASSTEE